jgi:hypothetical protein
VLADAAPVIAASVGVRAAFLWFKGPHAFSSDLGVWLEVGWRMSEGKNPYLATGYFVWPPVWVQILYALHRVSERFAIPLEFVITAFLIAVECVLIVVLIALLRELGAARPRSIALAGIALNPVCVILVCQHGNFDVLVALLVLLAVSALLRFQRSVEPVDWILACFWLGLAIALKSVPVLLTPLLVAGARRLAPRVGLLGLALAAGPAAYGLGVLRALNAGDVRAVLRYRSSSGWFGVTGWLSRVGRAAWVPAYTHAATAAFVAIGVGLAVLAWRGRLSAPHRLVAAASLPLVAVPAIGPGYGPQYFYWFWPLLLVGWALGDARLRRWIEIFGAVAAATYLFEYAVASLLGAFLAMRFPAARDWFLGATPDFARYTLVGTPLWLVYLVLTFALARRALGLRAPAAPERGRPQPAPA